MQMLVEMRGPTAMASSGTEVSARRYGIRGKWGYEPRQEFVDLRGGMACGDELESGLEVGVGLDPIHLRCLDQGSDPA